MEVVQVPPWTFTRQASPCPTVPWGIHARELLSLPWSETNIEAQAHLLMQGKAECMEMHSLHFKLLLLQLLS